MNLDTVILEMKTAAVHQSLVVHLQRLTKYVRPALVETEDHGRGVQSSYTSLSP